MDAISDVMAFATSNVDYWDELLSSSTFPDELSVAERAALEAAVAHVEDGVVSLLHAAAASLVAIAHVPPFAPVGSRRSATIKHRSVRLHCPKGRGSQLYYIGMCLVENDDRTRIELYPYLTVKKAKLDELRTRLSERGVPHQCEDYDLYGEGLELKKGESIATLAQKVAQRLVALVDGSA